MAAHFVHTSIALLASYAFRLGLLVADISNAAPVPWWWVALSTAAASAGGFILRRYLLAQHAPLVVPTPPAGRYQQPSLDALLER